jgi:uncharacterized protein YbjT (DUF2867 family)
MSKILVTGSTGNVGSRLVQKLVELGQPVRAFTRKGEAAKFDPAVEVVQGDFTDPDSLRAAMSGVSKMYLLSAGHDLPKHEANAVAAAKDAGLELVVKHSIAGAQWKAVEMGRWHRAGEELLEASGLPWVFLRNAAFATNAFGWIGSIKGQNTVYGALGETALPVIDPVDIASAAAVVLTKPGHAGQAYDLSGPAAITTDQQVQAIAQALGRPLTYVNVPDSAARDAMLGMGWPVPDVDAMIDFIQGIRPMGRIEPANGVQTLTGQAPRSFEQWVGANIAAFK